MTLFPIHMLFIIHLSHTQTNSHLLHLPLTTMHLLLQQLHISHYKILQKLQISRYKLFKTTTSSNFRTIHSSSLSTSHGFKNSNWLIKIEKYIHSFFFVDAKSYPTTYNEASKHLHWLLAMLTEFGALRNQHTWVTLPPPTT